MEMSKKCGSCKATIKGRSDKRFCNDLCRASYHYFNNRQFSFKLIQQIDRTLKKNRMLLCQLLIAGDIQVTKKRLVQMGFNFDHYTRISKESSPCSFFCYDIVYQIIDDDTVRIWKIERLESYNP